MAFPSRYVLPSGDLSPLDIADVTNKGLERELINLLSRMGLDPNYHDDLIVLTDVGVGEGDNSVTIVLDLVELNGKGVLLLQAFIAEAPPYADVGAMTVTGALSQQTLFGGVQVRTPQGSPEQVWLVVPIMQADLAEAPLQQALTLLAAEADFLDDLIARTWK